MEYTYTNLIVAFILFSIVSIWLLIQKSTTFSSSSNVPINWPVVGMLPGIIRNHKRFEKWCSEILLPIPSSTFLIVGPWMTNMDLLITSNPVNMQHIFCKHHSDFHKGSRFNEIFDYLGDGIFSSDDKLWKYQRRIALSTFAHPRLRQFMASSMKEKLEHGLIPLLDRWCIQESVIDIQDVFGRLMSDLSSIMIMGHDSKSLRFELPNHFLIDVAHHGEEVVLMRHLLPESVWKLQRWLGVGKEGSLKKAISKVDEFIYEVITKKKKEVKWKKQEKQNKNGSDGSNSGVDLFTLYIEEGYGGVEQGFKSNDCFLRDTFVNLFLAGQDTVSSALSWFFWLLSENPQVEEKIKEEIKAENNNTNKDDVNINKLLLQGGEEGVMKLVYLHAAIYETLRLYPPVPYNHRAACQEETLPSGHKVGPHTIILTCPYVMGRMPELWGEDCLEFKPERWITEQGTIRNEPAYKFIVFNAGPRVCPGKDIALVHMKSIILSLFNHNYRFEVVKGQRIEPNLSVVLHMKHGLKVRIIKD